MVNIGLNRFLFVATSIAGVGCMVNMGIIIIDGYQLSTGDNEMNIRIGIGFLIIESVLVIAAMELRGWQKFACVILGLLVFTSSVTMVAKSLAMGSMSSNTQNSAYQINIIKNQIKTYEDIIATRTVDGERLAKIQHSTSSNKQLNAAIDNSKNLDKLRAELDNLTKNVKPSTTGFFARIFDEKSTIQYEWYYQLIISFIIELSGLFFFSASVYFFKRSKKVTVDIKQYSSENYFDARPDVTINPEEQKLLTGTIDSQNTESPAKFNQIIKSFSDSCRSDGDKQINAND